LNVHDFWDDDLPLDTEQLSVFLGKNFVLTFQETPPGDCFEGARDRIRRNKGRIRQAGPDYLTYALLDAVTDSYFPILERYGELLENIEEEVLGRVTPEVAYELQSIRHDLFLMRRAMWPLRELLSVLQRDHSPLIFEETRLYLRDVYDHAVQ